MKFYLTTILLFFCTIITAQDKGQKEVDSLIAELPKTSNDSAKLKLLNKIVFKSQYYNPKLCSQYAEMGLELAKKIKWNKAIGVFHTLLGDVLERQNKQDLALKEYNTALQIHLQNKDTPNIATIYNNIGALYQRDGNGKKAIENFLLTVKLGEESNNNYYQGFGNNNIATVYTDQSDYAKALEYQLKALKFREAGENTDDVAETLINIGETYCYLKDSANAKKYLLKALQIAEQSGYKNAVARGYDLLAVFYPANSQEQLNYFLKSRTTWDSTDINHVNSISNLQSLGEYFLNVANNIPNTERRVSDNSVVTGKSNFLNKAAYYTEKGLKLSKEAGSMDNFMGLNLVYSNIEAAKGNYKNALELLTVHYKLHDSIYSQENKNKIASLESQKTIDIKDKEIEIGKLNIASQRKTQVGLIAGLGALALIGGLLYHQSRTRKKTNTTLLKLNTELDEANKVKATFFAILSHDLRQPVANLVNFLNLQKQAPDLLTKQQAETNQQKISTSAEGLLQTMEDMLLWSKQQMQQFKPQIKMVPVNNLYNHLQQFFSGTENISMTYNQQSGLQVSTDENYLQTIMHNLTANAVKALKNTPNAAIKWNAVEKDGKVLLSITDNGPGVAQEQVNALYDETIKTNEKTGLGLHIVRDLAKAIDCKIYIQSQPGNGTTFTIAA